jgi:signal transduction histidine kinase
MDFSTAYVSGGDAAREIHNEFPRAPILLLTLFLTEQLVEVARKNGIRGAASKTSLDELLDGIQAMTNVLRHAQTQSVDIEVDLDTNRVTQAIRDYGEGMPPEIVQKVRSGTGGGIGLSGMRERIVQFGGRFEIQSGESGALIRATLPLPDDNRRNTLS